MVSNYVLSRCSALSWNVKKFSVSGEVSRCLLNCSPDLMTEEYEDDVLEKLRWTMMLSGYSEIEREIIIREGKAWYINILKLVERRERQLCRPSMWKKRRKSFVKEDKRENLVRI